MSPHRYLLSRMKELKEVNKQLQEVIDDHFVESNVVPIRAQSDLGNDSEDWLSKLDEGTVFLCNSKTAKNIELTNYVLNEFTLLVKSDIGAICLKDWHEHIWVIPSVFCKKYSLFGVL